MDVEKVLKNLIIANFVVLGIIIAMGVSGYSTLPSALNDYSLALMDEYVFGTILVLPLLLAYIIAYVLMYKLKPLGRTLFLWTNIVALFLYFFTGPVILDELTATLDNLLVLFDGVILGIVYFSPLKEKFTK